MSIVVYRNGVMAADTQVGSLNSIKPARVCKLRRNDRGELAGAVGDAAWSYQWLMWFNEKGEVGFYPQPKEDGCSSDVGIIVRRSGHIDVHGPRGVFSLSDVEYYAIGSGAPEAFGALFYGASAEDAVRAAITFDPHCGGDVTVLKADWGDAA